MADQDKQLVVNLVAWLFNVSTSVVIVFINKVLMGAAGYGFNYAVTLCALHFLACGAGVAVMQMAGIMQTSNKYVPWVDRVIFAFAANVSIASLNLSLMINSVGFYQIAKLLIIPFTAVVEAVWLGERLSLQQTLCTAVVLAGVAIVTVSDVTASMLGIVIAAVSIASSSMQQILCRFYLRKHEIASNELLGITAPLQGWSLLAIGPLADYLITSRWIVRYELNVPALLCLAASCATAVLVNISQFMCLGRFSAVTFQVTGHAKTVAVLIGSWAYLNESVGTRELLGMGLAVVGMVAYGYFASQVKARGASGTGAPAPAPPGSSLEKAALLGSAARP